MRWGAAAQICLRPSPPRSTAPKPLYPGPGNGVCRGQEGGAHPASKAKENLAGEASASLGGRGGEAEGDLGAAGKRSSGWGAERRLVSLGGEREGPLAAAALADPWPTRSVSLLGMCANGGHVTFDQIREEGDTDGLCFSHAYRRGGNGQQASPWAFHGPRKRQLPRLCVCVRAHALTLCPN